MKTLFITGANQGIGYELVREWLHMGNAAAAADLNCGNIDLLKSEYPDTLMTFTVDVRELAALEKAVSVTAEKFGEIGYAVHNACLCLFKGMEEHSLQDYQDVLDVNFLGAVRMTRAVLPVMKRRNAGRVFFTSSGVGVTGFPGISAYAASKGAIESFAKCMNLEHAGITFHLLHPPLTATKSSEPLPVPREFMASAERVGRGLARRLDKKAFIIAPGFGDALSLRMSYLFSVSMGRLLAKMTARSSAPAAKA